MGKQNKYGLISALFFALAVVAMVATANATNRYDDDGIETTAVAGAKAGAEAGANAEATGGNATGGNAASDASANSGGNEFSVEGDRVENNSSNVVLVPNNNTESCIRVWGFAWGENGTSGALGVPWRSKACDYEQAADDAFAAGERELGWYWKCHNKTLYKPFLSRGKDTTRDEENVAAISACHARAVGEITKNDTIANLRNQLEFLQNEQAIEREKCKESKDRINEAWRDSCQK